MCIFKCIIKLSTLEDASRICSAFSAVRFQMSPQTACMERLHWLHLCDLLTLSMFFEFHICILQIKVLIFEILPKTWKSSENLNIFQKSENLPKKLKVSHSPSTRQIKGAASLFQSKQLSANVEEWTQKIRVSGQVTDEVVKWQIE